MSEHNQEILKKDIQNSAESATQGEHPQILPVKEAKPVPLMDLVSICAPPDFEINNSLRIYDKLLKNHSANENTLAEMKNSLDTILKRMGKETRNDEYQPTLKKIKLDPKNVPTESAPDNIGASNRTISTNTIGASADSGITPLMDVATPLMPFSNNY